MNRSTQEAGSQSQELKLLSDLSPAGGWSESGSVVMVTETEPADGWRRPRPRGLASYLQLPTADDTRRDKHATVKEPTDVKKMETDLLNLMQAFNSGSLRAFGKDVSVEQMEQIREQQERLARLHFEMGAQQELLPPLSDEGLSRASDSLQQLMAMLSQLSTSIEKLHVEPPPPAEPGS